MTYSTDRAVEMLTEVARLNRDEPLREGNVITLPRYGQVVMTGDLHGSEENFRRLQYYADLDRCPQRYVVMHELIHRNTISSPDRSIEDTSCRLLLKACEWKLEFPDQIFFMLANHDLAQLTDRDITKGGYSSIAGFNAWVFNEFGSGADAVLTAINETLTSFPLAIRCPNRIWLSHSLPGPWAMETFDETIFTRAIDNIDMLPGGSVYEMVWGRGQTAKQLKGLCDTLDVDHFVVGHKAQESGYDAMFDKILILASEHYEGCFVPIDLSQRYTFEELLDRIRYFHQLAMPEEQIDHEMD